MNRGELADLLERLCPPVTAPRAMHCGKAVWNMLRACGHPLRPDGAHATRGGSMANLSDIPVYVEDDMPNGAWQWRDATGAVIASGDLAPDYPHALYVPGVGMIAFTGGWPVDG